jgi:hypothetical protein
MIDSTVSDKITIQCLLVDANRMLIIHVTIIVLSLESIVTHVKKLSVKCVISRLMGGFVSA